MDMTELQHIIQKLGESLQLMDQKHSVFIFNECQAKLDRISIYLEEEYT